MSGEFDWLVRNRAAYALTLIEHGLDAIDHGDFAKASPEEAVANCEALLRIQARAAVMAAFLERVAAK